MSTSEIYYAFSRIYLILSLTLGTIGVVCLVWFWISPLPLVLIVSMVLAFSSGYSIGMFFSYRKGLG